MPILENIKAAEEKAESLRIDAQNQVENLLNETRIKAKENASKILEEANKTIQNNNQENINLIQKLEKDNLENIEKDKEALLKLAKKNQEIGVNYILKRVVEI